MLLARFLHTEAETAPLRLFRVVKSDACKELAAVHWDEADSQPEEAPSGERFRPWENIYLNLP